jgi:chromatin remodeling complex protein RSC6
LLSSAELKKVVSDYIKKENLLSPNQKHYVQIDMLLKTFLRKNERDTIVTLPVGELHERLEFQLTVFFSSLILRNRVQDQMRQFYEITFPGKQPFIQ